MELTIGLLGIAKTKWEKRNNKNMAIAIKKDSEKYMLKLRKMLNKVYGGMLQEIFIDIEHEIRFGNFHTIILRCLMWFVCVIFHEFFNRIKLLSFLWTVWILRIKRLYAVFIVVTHLFASFLVSFRFHSLFTKPSRPCHHWNKNILKNIK